MRFPLVALTKVGICPIIAYIFMYMRTAHAQGQQRRFVVISTL